ncbi:NUMOD4 domain-containing protein [uncultured Lentilactobacillus sp.]|uniref:NUMOD4 domain-containing protein n=1 Tax=uncultured Lentilactobacillus sp. TaxID=2805375 RepID=UPI002594CAC2|nr:NUMOD4 domain-containing protein [uncultured Lentilactobacillus sp.]
MNDNIEIWKNIQGYEGLYQVSNFGRVRSLDKKVKCRGGKYRLMSGRIMRSVHSGTNYSAVNLYKGKHHRMQYVHRLVAEAFIPNPNGYLEINHKDENKENNNVSNLEWCDRTYNNNYGIHNLRISQARKSNVKYTKQSIRNGQKQSKPVVQFTLDGKEIKEYPSTAEAGRQNGFKKCAIANCCCGRQKTSYGYIWKYK